jgi:hypothetical protein
MEICYMYAGGAEPVCDLVFCPLLETFLQRITIWYDKKR